MKKHSAWLIASVLTGLLLLGNHAVAKKSKAKKAHKISNRSHKGLPPKRTFMIKRPRKLRTRRVRYIRRRRGVDFNAFHPHIRRRKGVDYTAFERRFLPKKWAETIEKNGQKQQKKKVKKQTKRVKKSRRGAKHQ